MKFIKQLAVCGVVLAATVLPSMATSSFNESSNNWDGMAWERGGYFKDYYPNEKTGASKKHHHNYD